MRKYLILGLALGLGIFTRSYQYLDRFNYAHDNDLASWIVRDIVIDKHLRLIGQLTSSPGVYIGALWYYLQIPFYLAGHMDPIYVPILAILVGVAAIASLYWVMAKVFSPGAGSIAALLYATSWSISLTEHDVVPTTPVFLWTIWFFYAINLLLQGNKKGLWIVAVLSGLIWHFNLALVFSVPLVIGVLIYKWRQFKWQDLVGPAVLALIVSLPLLFFEARHNFSQLRAIVGGTSPTVEITLGWKMHQIFFYAAKNVNNLFWVKPDPLSWYLVPLALIAVGVYLQRVKKISIAQALLIVAWWGSYIIIFALNPLNLSEYYLNGVSIIWIVILALFLTSLLKRFRWAVVIFLALVMMENLYVVINQRIDHSGYIQKKALVGEIVKDAKAHNYPCVAVSYMTDQGRDLGYRHWFWLANLKVKTPASEAPVYTIVFPHTRAGRLDQTFGSLGLIYPDYYRYTKASIDQNCQGDNQNLTLPMFGFTK